MPFPVSIYDRPAISLANMASGDIGGAFQAVFDPMDLGPNQMQNLREKILKNKTWRDNPFIATITDLATNPLMWIGMAMALHPVYGKVAKADEILALTKAGTRYSKDTLGWLKNIVSPFTGYRAFWHTGLMDEIIGHVHTSSIFAKKYSDEVADHVLAYKSATGTGLSKADKTLVAMKMEFWDKPLKYGADGKVITGKATPLLEHYSNYFRKQGVETLFPNLDKSMSPELKQLAQKMRVSYDRIGKDLFREAKNSGVVLEEFSRKGTDMLPGYFPHMTSQSNLVSEASTKFGVVNPKSYARTLREAFSKREAGIIRNRMGRSMPLSTDIESVAHLMPGNIPEMLNHLERRSIQEFKTTLLNLYRSGKHTDLDAIKTAMGSVDPGAVSQLKATGGFDEFILKMREHLVGLGRYNPKEGVETALSNMATAMGAPTRYSMDAVGVTEKYIQVAGPTFGWISKGYGPRMMKIIDDIPQQIGIQMNIPGVSSESVRWVVNDFKDSLGPMLRGMKDSKEWARQQHFQDVAYKAQLWLSGEGKVQKAIPANARKWMVEALSGSRGGLSSKSIGGRIASMFYVSTLGLNVSPISKNMLQNLITTVNIMGPEATAKGLTDVAKRMPKFAELASKVGVDEAVRLTFPGYYKWFGHEGISAAMGAGDIAKEGTAISGATNIYERVKQGMMMPFAASEKLNRFWAFYAGQAKGLTDGLGKEAAREFAAKMTMFTQFPGGVLGQPKALRGVWSPFRQFLHFPMRYMEYLYGSMRMGPDPMKISTGVLGRTIAGSTGMYTAAKNLLGMDISGGLVGGAIPTPGYEGAPFYPFPFVPPLLSTTGEAASSLLTGDYSKMENVAAMLIPSGLAARRGFKAWAPRYADYQKRTPDGRIPIYNDKHMLIGNVTGMQLAMRGLGLKPTEIQSEGDMMKYLLTHRDRIRQYRRDYLEAMANNDLEQARKVNKAFQKKYPALGPIKVKKADIRAIETRKTVSRLNRTLKGFSASDRPVFAQMIEQSQLADFARQLDDDPSGATLQGYLGQ